MNGRAQAGGDRTTRLLQVMNSTSDRETIASRPDVDQPPAQPPFTSSTPEHVRKWVGEISRGLGLLFWTLLLSVFFVNAAGFALPFVGRPSADLKWIGLIHTAAGPLLVIAVFRLSAPGPQPASNRPRLRSSLRYCVILEFVVRIAYRFFRIADVQAVLSVVAIPFEAVSFTCVLLGLMYLRHLSEQFSFRRRAQVFRVFTWVYMSTWLVESALRFMPLSENSKLPWVMWLVFEIGVVSALDILALLLLWRFRTEVRRVLNAGECHVCEYDLTGNTSGVCPECGTRVWFIREKRDG